MTNQIPKVYSDQALKPKGQTVNERLNFLIAWYAKSASTVNPSDPHQAQLLQLMGEWAIILQEDVFSNDENTTKQNIVNLLERIKQINTNTKNTARNSFFFYLVIELTRVIEPNT